MYMIDIQVDTFPEIQITDMEMQGSGKIRAQSLSHNHGSMHSWVILFPLSKSKIKKNMKMRKLAYYT